MKIRLKVVPSASREHHEWMDDEHSLLKVRVTAPPEKGKANKAVEKYLARQLQLPPTKISIASGLTSQQKTVDIQDIQLQTLIQALEK